MDSGVHQRIQYNTVPIGKWCQVTLFGMDRTVRQLNPYACLSNGMSRCVRGQVLSMVGKYVGLIIKHSEVLLTGGSELERENLDCLSRELPFVKKHSPCGWDWGLDCFHGPRETR